MKFSLKSSVAVAVIGMAMSAAVAFAQAPSAGVSAAAMPMSLCMDIGANVYQGVSNANVTTLQNYLFANGYLAVSPTGYFGRLTFAAVMKFQASQGLPTTGYVGVLTRGKIKTLTCGNPGPATSITVVSPNGGESWQRGTTQNIAWNYSTKLMDSASRATPSTVTVTLSQYPNACTGRPVCTLMLLAPYVIGNVPNTGSYSWNVGSIQDVNGRTLPDGTYKMKICTSDNGACGESSSQFTITSGTVATPVISNLNPTSGIAGATVTLTGTGFSKTSNTVRLTSASNSIDTSISSIVSPDGMLIKFQIPSYVGNTCAPGMMCAMFARTLPAGSYLISVTTDAGVTTNSVMFTVLASGNTY